MTKIEFMTAYILARASALTGSVTSAKLVASAANVWQEIQYETGAEERPQIAEDDMVENEGAPLRLVGGVDPETGEPGQ